jgi:hypothetical protein
MRLPGLIAVAMATSTLVMLGGCAADQPAGVVSSTQQTPPASPRFDPPQRFAAQGSQLPVTGSGGMSAGNPLTDPLAVTLEGTTAYVTASEGLLVVDTTSKRSPTVIRTQQPPAGVTTNGGGSGFLAPIVTDLGGGTVVLAAFVVTVPGHGTTPAHGAVEILVADAVTHQQAWCADIDLSGLLASDTQPSTAQVLGVNENIAVIAVTDSGDGVLLGVDVRSRQVVWKQQKVLSAVMGGDSVTGVVAKDAAGVRQQVTGFAVGDGHQLWQQPATYQAVLSAAGPKLVAAGGRDYDSGHGFFRLLDAQSGATVQQVDGDSSDLMCAYDRRSTTVCSGPDSRRAFAIDAASGAFLWQLPDTAANRVAPTVTAVWHGAVYGYTDNGPLVLDARTGADRNDSPGIAPEAVDEVVGLAPPKGTNGPVTAYPAIR